MEETQKKMSFLDIVWRYKGTLAVYIFAVSLVSFAVLYSVGGVPDEFKVAQATGDDEVESVERDETNLPHVTEQAQQDAIYPDRIVIDKIGVNTVVQNPASSDLHTLNNELLKGVVRYPGSGTVGKGNMFVFGHSTSFKIVNNQAYKAFNRLSELDIGDKITVVADGKSYTYKVVTVSLVDSDKAMVDLSSTKSVLTLSTCNVFGKKQERFVVEAVLSK